MEECTICLEEITKGNEVKCSTCIYLCCKDCYDKLQTKRCPTCRQFNCSDTYIKFWCNGNKMVERKIGYERRWWSNGNEKYHLDLDENNPKIVTAGYYNFSDMSRTYNITQFTEEEINQMRNNWDFCYM